MYKRQGIILAFVYGYGGMFAAGNMTLANLYPITAGLGIVGYRSYDTAVSWNLPVCIFSLAFVVLLSAIDVYKRQKGQSPHLFPHSSL